MHVHECNREETVVFFEAAYHALLALGVQEEALVADFANGTDGAADILAYNLAQLEIRLGLVGLWDHGHHFKDVDAAVAGTVFAFDDCGAGGHEQFALVGVLGNL